MKNLIRNQWYFEKYYSLPIQYIIHIDFIVDHVMGLMKG